MGGTVIFFFHLNLNPKLLRGCLSELYFLLNWCYFSSRESSEVARVSLLWCVRRREQRWTVLREARHVIKAWERQREETNSSRGIDLSGKQPFHKHHSQRTSSCYEARGRRDLRLFWQFKRFSGQGEKSGGGVSLEAYDQWKAFEGCDARSQASVQGLKWERGEDKSLFEGWICSNGESEVL